MLVKLYVREPGTARMLELAQTAPEGSLLLSSLATVEVAAALCALERGGKLAAADREQLLRRFHEHLGWRFVRQPVSDGLLALAAALAQRRALRAYDAVQLAAALGAGSGEARPLTFVCSDRALLEAATLEGLACLDPATPGAAAGPLSPPAG